MEQKSGLSNKNSKEKYVIVGSVQDTISYSIELRAKQDASNDEAWEQDKNYESHDTTPEDLGVDDDENGILRDLITNK